MSREFGCFHRELTAGSFNGRRRSFDVFDQKVWSNNRLIVLGERRANADAPTIAHLSDACIAEERIGVAECHPMDLRHCSTRLFDIVRHDFKVMNLHSTAPDHIGLVRHGVGHSGAELTVDALVRDHPMAACLDRALAQGRASVEEVALGHRKHFCRLAG